MGKGPFGNMVPPQPTADQRGGGAQSATPADSVIQFTTAFDSSLSDRTGAVQFSVAGIAGFEFEARGFSINMAMP